MVFKSGYATKEDFESEVPDQHRELFTEKGGKWEFTGVAGLRSAEEFTRIDTALKKERKDHAAAKAVLAKWGEYNPDDVIPKLDNIEALEQQYKSGPDAAKNEEAISKRVEAALKAKLAPLERANKELAEKLRASEEQVSTYSTKERKRTIRDAVAVAASELKVLDTAREDALLQAEALFEVGDDGVVRTRDQVGVTPGQDPKGWLLEIQPKKPHWWPGSQGGGAPHTRQATGGENPWAAGSWNVTKQGEFMRKHGSERAAQAAKAAGSSIGATQPPQAAKR